MVESNKVKSTLSCSVFSAEYWREAFRESRNIKTLVFAALIIALRVIVKMFRIPLAAGLNLTFDCYVNALGSIVYGPVVALLVGAISDTLGVLLFPGGVYFFPFIFVEMTSSFIFALFLWRKKISVPRVLLSKFSINLICNIIMTSTFLKWQYYLLGDKKFETYNIINGTRIVKNLVLFPIEAVLIVIILSALLPALKATCVVPAEQHAIKLKSADIVLIILFFLLSAALVLFYIFFLKDFIAAHNFKFF